jgi:uncharacterized membrane protein YjgN (DUF898 family)
MSVFNLCEIKSCTKCQVEATDTGLIFDLIKDESMDTDKTPDSQNFNGNTQGYVTNNIEFLGKASTFFGIWIVNVLLSIITLGIYSAWATVRTNNYFYSNTKLDGHVFSYLAKPLQILRGRILAIIFFVIYALVTNFNPVLGIILSLLLLIAMPWIIVQSLRFNNRMISYRNVRFDFHGTYGGAFVHFVLLPILGVITLYLAMPWVLKKMKSFVLSNTSYGETKLTTALSTGQYYKTFLIAFLILAVFVGALFGLAFAATSNLGLQFFSALPPSTLTLVGVAYLATFTFIRAVVIVQIRNHILANTELEGLAKFKSSLTIPGYAFLEVTNMLALICSLGLAYPWVAIRSARFFAERTQVEINTAAASAIDIKSRNDSSIGSETAEAFDLGVSVV